MWVQEMRVEKSADALEDKTIHEIRNDDSKRNYFKPITKGWGQEHPHVCGLAGLKQTYLGR